MVEAASTHTERIKVGLEDQGWAVSVCASDIGQRCEEGEEEKIPEPPSPDVPQGVLPRLIATLVGRRRQVKSLMKDKSISQAKYLQVSWGTSHVWDFLTFFAV